jgi:hypothetical protein
LKLRTPIFPASGKPEAVIGLETKTRNLAVLLVLAALSLPLVATTSLAATQAPTLTSVGEFTVDPTAMCQLRQHFVDHLLATYPAGTWAPMKMTLSDDDLALMGLPPRDVLLAQRYDTPTAVFPDGTTQGVSASALASYAGTGCLGIRPGAWLLLLSPDAISLCSMAHVYGTPGSYQISTAGHCGNVGDTATVIAAVGNFDRPFFGLPAVSVPILLDFGKFVKSTGDAGIGKDWALIGINTANQGLVSPTMCFWGGPIGQYKDTGATLAASLLGRNLISGPTLNTDPFLVQGIVHYGHGAGIGTDGTPRAGTAFYWTSSTMIWEGAITPGDSGSASNTLTGDAVGAEREAAGINTHIFVDASLNTGIGYLASTRATLVTATMANGQLIPYPAPVPGAP